MRLYTYGQPRTGNQAYADLVNKLFGDQSFRYVRTTDGRPDRFPPAVRLQAPRCRVLADL
ncbi:hypothetical protein B0H14DRAFT_2759336 [Mycena olivaceomarginata]|nr:hypothetical protein B0H14DRAFT_2759336 [Mycena olivaceomarginata]